MAEGVRLGGFSVLPHLIARGGSKGLFLLRRRVIFLVGENVVGKGWLYCGGLSV